MKKTWVVLLVLVSLFQLPVHPGETLGASPCGDSLAPPFIASGVKPNILIVLDNSNSMDEDFYGNAVGSYSTASKSVIAKQALQNLLVELKDKANVGLMTYNLPSDTDKGYLYNDYYFASYNPNSYCANPPDACQTWCVTDSLTAKAECQASCPNLTITDTIITSNPANSSYRQTYCPLVFPKTQRAVNPKDTGNYIYYKGAYPLYTSSSSYGNVMYAYSDHYSTSNNASNSYDMYKYKSGTNDDDNNYSNGFGSWTFNPTDTDIALGFYNFGKRQAMTYVGRTWYSNSTVSSGSQGYLKVAVGDLSNTTQFNNVNNMLNPYAGDMNGYMACTANDPDTCSYVVNSGLTPTAGTLKAAQNYFNGSYSGQSSPITSSCQKNYVIYVTDGLPDTNLAGSTRDNLTNVMNEVKSQLSSLQTQVKKTISGKSYTFPVKTYVLGMGLSPQAKTNLDQMAITGGTPTSTGHAYYADSADDLTAALETIVTDLLGRVASGSSISILSEGQTQMGANMLQGVFYPSKYFGTTSLSWPGYLYDYWFYNGESVNNIREDTVHDYILTLDQDNRLEFNFNNQDGLSLNFYSDPTGKGEANTLVNSTPKTLDDVSPIWEAGKMLLATPAANRKIYTVGSSGGLVNFDAANSALTTPASSLLGAASGFDACLRGANDTATLQNLINYVRGTDLTNCRNRTVGMCWNGSSYNSTPCSSDSDCSSPYNSCKTNVWKLGDIVYSSPQVRTDYKYCSTDGTAFNNQACTTDSDCTSPTYTSCKKKESVVFVGANDGMLHAFKTGILTDQGVDKNQHQVEKLTGIPNADSGKELWGFIPKNSLPYLRCLAVPPPNTCHLYYNDLSPYITQMTVGSVTKTVLIGGMRLGGGAIQTTPKYCLNSSGSPNGVTCNSTSDCVSPYNSSCAEPEYCLSSSGVTNGAYCTNKNNCALGYKNDCAPLQYCFNSAGATNGTTCAAVSNCSAPYNSSCSVPLHTSAPSDTCSPIICPDPASCYSPPTCTGLSSYYALDITDVENPKLLWEFSHPLLGYSYSGPAIIHKKYTDANGNTGSHYFVMFTSGPTVAATGSSIQDIQVFVLSLDSNLAIGSLYEKDLGNTTKNGFSGRLFTTGVDIDLNDDTDYVLFGYGYSSTGNTGDWKGGIGVVGTSDSSDPANWSYDVSTYANIAQLPITSKVETMKCFDRWYLFAGTGRYFFPMDNFGPPSTGANSGRNFIMGVPFCNTANQDCKLNINYVNDNATACNNLQRGDLEKAAWQYDLDDAETGADGNTYLKERLTTDPSISNNNMVFFTTDQPTSDPCGYGGRTRVWGMNCATGAAITDQSCGGYNITDLGGTLYLQTSTGAINKIDASTSFTENGGLTSPWTAGIPPENAPPVTRPSTTVDKQGQIIYWIER